MTSLIELAALTTDVKVMGKTIKVIGVSAGGLAQLLNRFPALLKAMSGGNLDSAALMKVGPEAVAALIATGCGEGSNKKAEEAAAKLPIEAQLDILAAIVKLTFPSGVGPFVKKLEGLGLLAQGPSQQSTSSDGSSMNSEEPAIPTQ